MLRTFFGVLAVVAVSSTMAGAFETSGGAKAYHGRMSPALWENAKAAIAENPSDTEAIGYAQGLLRRMERDKVNWPLAATAEREFATILRQSQNPQLESLASRYEAASRRFSLPGHGMKIGGTLIDGSTFDASQLKGKVVLVDFWATWCGPCCAELPNVKRAYQKYHDAGFEVVGVSLDSDMDTLAQFLEAQQIPWPIMVGGTEAGRGFDQPLAAYYGVSSIPTAILIDQNGRVVSLGARGAELNRLLQAIFGE